MLAVGAGGGCLDIFSLVYYFSFLSPSLWEKTLYGLKYCLKGLLSPKEPTEKLKVQGHNVRESNSAAFIFATFLTMESTLKGKSLLLEEQILSYQSRPHFKGVSSSREAIKK